MNEADRIAGRQHRGDFTLDLQAEVPVMNEAGRIAGRPRREPTS